MNRLSRFDAGYRMLGAGALGWPREIIGFFFLLFYFILLYNTVLVLPYINMNPPRVYMCSQSWTPLPPPSPYHLSGSSQCTSPAIPASCIKPGQVIHFTYILYMFQCHSPHSSQTHPLPQSPKNCSVSLLLSRMQGYHYHLSKFHQFISFQSLSCVQLFVTPWITAHQASLSNTISHIYALLYCIGVFLSGLLHSV